MIRILLALLLLAAPAKADERADALAAYKAKDFSTAYKLFGRLAEKGDLESIFYLGAIAHRDGERAVLDALRAWRPPFNPSGVIAEAADLLRQYGIRETTGDRYAPGFVSEGFRLHGIKYVFAEQDRSALYLDLLPRVNSRAVLLLDLPELLRELRGLERRRGNRPYHSARGADAWNQPRLQRSLGSRACPT